MENTYCSIWMFAAFLQVSKFLGFLLYFSVQYQMEMMRNLRKVNIDHLHVGWYQSTYFGGFINRALLDSQYNYQFSIEESVVLIYGRWLDANIYLCCWFPRYIYRAKII